MAILPFSAMSFMALQGFIYAIPLDIYAFLPAFCRILHCILQQNALRLAAYCTAFCSKLQYILQQIAPNMVQIAVS